MEESKVSLTALMAAFQRGYHYEHDNPKICNDFLAFDFLSLQERAIFTQQYTRIAANYFRDKTFPSQDDALAFFIQNVSSTSDMISRARYTEDLVAEAVKNEGLQQYVILGAGLDTFAFRRPDLLKRLRVFEIDHPATQNFKCRRIAELGWKKPANLHFIPVDFTKENFDSALARSPYDAKALTFFSWLGVTYYLPQDTIFATLRTIADICPSGSGVIFDYYDTDAFDPEKAAPRMQGWKHYTKQAGEPIITGFSPAALAMDIKDARLQLRENLGPTEIESRYFQGRTDNYHATEHTHFAWAAVE